jgi:hypothetical protein
MEYAIISFSVGDKILPWQFHGKRNLRDIRAKYWYLDRNAPD